MKRGTSSTAGVREVLPIAQGIELLDEVTGEDRAKGGLVAIGTGPAEATIASYWYPELHPTPFDLGRYKFVGIASGALNTAIDELLSDEIENVRRIDGDPDHMLVMPSVAIGSTTDIDPGIVQILTSYGWMRAFDAYSRYMGRVADEDWVGRYWQLTERIVQLRYACWTLERQGHSFREEYPDLFRPLVNLWAPLLRAGLSLPSGGSGTPAEREAAFWEAVPEGWLFATNTKVGGIGFGRSSRADEDLVARIRAHKATLAEMIGHRVRMHGLDSLPSFHELSNPRAGNLNTFADWVRGWEGHGVTAQYDATPGSAEPNPAGPRWPTGPGLRSSDGGLDWTARSSTPWDAQPRYDYRTVTPRELADGLSDDTKWPHRADPRRLTFSTTPAADPGEHWFWRDPDWRLVRHEGFVAASPLGGLVQLAVYERDGGDTWTTTRGAAEMPGDFGRGQHLGYVHPPGGTQPTGSVPLVTWYSPSQDDHLTSCDVTRFFEGNPHSHGEWRARSIAPDYEFERLEGFVPNPEREPGTGWSRIYRWVSFARRDHALTNWPAAISGRPVGNTPVDLGTIARGPASP